MNRRRFIVGVLGWAAVPVVALEAPRIFLPPRKIWVNTKPLTLWYLVLTLEGKSRIMATYANEEQCVATMYHTTDFHVQQEFLNSVQIWECTTVVPAGDKHGDQP